MPLGRELSTLVNTWIGAKRVDGISAIALLSGVSRHAADAVASQKLAHAVQNCTRGFLPLTDLNRDGTHAAASAPREGWHLEFLHLRSTSALVSEAAYCFG